MIALPQLKQLLHYNALTGVFVWTETAAKRPKSRIVAGAVAGCVYRSTGYVVIVVDNKRYLAHRLAWFYVYGVWPSQLDHIDRNKQNNAIKNLREVTPQQNKFNVAVQKNNRSGVKGVCWVASRQRWKAYGWLNGKGYHLGMFMRKEDAVSRRLHFELMHHAAFSKGV